MFARARKRRNASDDGLTTFAIFLAKSCKGVEFLSNLPSCAVCAHAKSSDITAMGGAGPGVAPGATAGGRAPMHWIDRIELDHTLSQIREEARSLAQGVAHERRLLGLRRIVALLNYMMEHLEMVGVEADREPG